MPFAAVVLEPLHTRVREAVPFLCPCGDTLLIFHVDMELLREQMAALTDDQATIIRPIWMEVDETLETAEPWLLRILKWMLTGNHINTIHKSLT